MLILICGGKRAGKDTFINFFIQEIALQYRVEKIALSDPIKTMVCKQFSISREILEMYKCKNNEVTIFQQNMRKMLQNTGDGFKDQFGKLVFCNLARDILQNSKYDITIISDIRLEMEHQYFKKKYPDCISIKIIPDKFPLSQFIDNHQSEKEWQDLETDYSVFNTFGDIDGLRKSAKEIAEGRFPVYIN